MKRLIIKEAWNAYVKQVGLSDMGPNQRRELQRAFYAGANVLFGSIMTMLTPGPEAEKADLALLENIQVELEDFLDAVRRGMA